MTYKMIASTVIIISIAIFLCERNNRLYKYRVDLVMNNWFKYKKLPSYNEMFWKFWRTFKSFED